MRERLSQTEVLDFPGSETLRRHLSRLHAVVDLGVIGEPPAEQARRILSDSVDALGFDYGELGEAMAEGYVRLCAVGESAQTLPGGVGARGLEREKPFMIFDVLQDDTRDHSAAALGLRSVLYWPFGAGRKRCVLTLGWNSPRDHFVGEGEIAYLELLANLISRLLEALEQERKIARRADTDALTGIPNRAAVLEHLTAAISSAQRGETTLALLYIDLNNFKKINDEHGHAIGDAALRGFAARLQAVVRRHEMCGRLGGDEFCLVVSSFSRRSDLEIVARRVLEALGNPIAVAEGMALTVSGSVGIAVYPADGQSAGELLGHADRAMYRAKSEGGAAFMFYADAAPTRFEESLKIDSANFMRQFVLCYQPIVAARTGRPIAAEVFPRWMHPDGMRPPERFLQVAQSQGLLERLDTLVFESVLRTSVQNRDCGSLVFHVNVSEPSPALLETLPRPVTAVALEFGEEHVAADPGRHVEFAQQCRARGVRVGLSHFGSNHLSLRSLAQMRPDFVKISASEAAGRDGREYVKMLIEHAARVAPLVIAQTVESAAEADWLVANGVDALQGFTISAPMAEQDFFAWLRRSASRT